MTMFEINKINKFIYLCRQKITYCVQAPKLSVSGRITNYISALAHVSSPSFDCLCVDFKQLQQRQFLHSTFRLNVGTGLNIFRTGQRLALHVWHKVSITRDTGGVSLVVDEEVIHMTSKPNSLGVRLRGNMNFGGIMDALDR